MVQTWAVYMIDRHGKSGTSPRPLATPLLLERAPRVVCFVFFCHCGTPGGIGLVNTTTSLFYSCMRNRNFFTKALIHIALHSLIRESERIN